MNDRNNKIVFWGCFIALITTAFGFIARVFLVKGWALQFDLDTAQAGRDRKSTRLNSSHT